MSQVEKNKLVFIASSSDTEDQLQIIYHRYKREANKSLFLSKFRLVVDKNDLEISENKLHVSNRKKNKRSFKY